MTIDPGLPRWDGRAGRLEVWYVTFTDADGTGYWIHQEVVAPTTTAVSAQPPTRWSTAHNTDVGGDGPRVVGWLAVFPPDGSPELVRFGPAPVERSAAADPAAGTGRSGAGDWCRVGDNVIGAGYMRGAAGKWSWDLELEGGEPPL